MSSSERIARDIFAPVASSSSASASTPARSREPRRPSATTDSMTTPARPRAGLAPSALLSSTQTSPAYTSSLRSRHSLYGTEDRVVLDLGSRIWKAGFSGEGSPRECKSVLTMIGAEEGSGYGAVGLWGLDKGVDDGEWEVREERLKRGLRDVWFNHLMSDPKARKVIVLENALLSTKVKEMIARVLFENLQVPSLSFASSHLLALMATGSVTGLVIDCGNLELTALPIYSSRPLFSHLLSSPRAGSQINQRLKSLLLQFGLYVPPPSSLNSTTPPVRTRIPKEVLTEELLEEIKCRTCFVAKGGVQEGDEEESFEDEMDDEEEVGGESVRLLKRMQRRWAGKSETTTISFKVPGFSAPPVTSGVGRGWIQVPGWVRERAAEVLWEKGDEDEMSLSEMVLEALLKLPTDLRRPLASTLVVTGGTAMLPGFFSRLRYELLHTLSLSSATIPPPPTSPTTPHSKLQRRLSTFRTAPRFAPIVPLSSSIAILNDPSLVSSYPSIPLPPNSGSAPAFVPALLPWVGGSLSGALKTGGEEIMRERWEEGEGVEGADVEEEQSVEVKSGFVLPDWSSLRLRQRVA